MLTPKEEARQWQRKTNDVVYSNAGQKVSTAVHALCWCPPLTCTSVWQRTLDDWKQDVLKLPENQGWTKAELNKWLEGGGRYHKMPDYMSESRRMVRCVSPS